MNRQTSIIYTTPIPECWTNLKKFCKAKGLSYNTVSKKTKQLEAHGLEHNGYKYFRVRNQ